MTGKKPTHNNTTITVSVPFNVKDFLNKLASDGYNRSKLILAFLDGLEVLDSEYQNVPLPRGIAQIVDQIKSGELAARHAWPELDRKIRALIESEKGQENND